MLRGAGVVGARRGVSRGAAGGTARAAAAALLILLGGCTRESVRVAMDAQRRADQVQQAVFDRQHEGLRVLLFRDAVARLERAGPLNASQVAALSDAWNERDLVEFWQVQHERARALRLVGVDAFLASNQSVVDLLVKQVLIRLDRGLEGAAGAVGEAAVEAAKDMAGG